jgi:DNA-binding NarL/FixJ family response regulator
MTDHRVIAVVPSPQEFQRIYGSLASDNIVVEHASSLLGAVLAHVQWQSRALAESTPEELLAQGPVILYDADPSPFHQEDWQEDWRAALQQFLRVHPGSRVVFLSRVADEEMWIEVLNSGGHDLLSKPFSDTELRQAMRRAFLSDRKTLATAA